MIRKYAYIIVCTLLFASPSILLSANLANNPGFENWTAGNPDDWSSDNKIILSQETDTIHGGSYSAQVVCTTQTQAETDFWHTSQISVTADQEYSFTAWVYDNDIAGRVRIYIQSNIGISWPNIYSSDNSNWQQLSYEWTAPTGATWAKPSFRFYDTSPWDGDAVFYIDDVYFSSYPSTDSGNIVINEIMYNPSLTQGSDANFEWIELWNIDSDTMDVSGWTITDVEDTFDIPGGAIIPPWHFIIIPSNPNSIINESEYSDNLGTGNDYVTTASGLQLSNSGDEVVVRNGDNKFIDSLSYGTTSPWPTEANGNDPSLELINPELDNTQGANWLAATENYGTPGDTNSTFRWISTTGNSGTYWDQTSTWTPEGVPTKDFGAQINSSKTVTIRDAGGDAYCKDLFINGTLTYSGGSDDTLFIYGNWENDGTFNRGSSTVAFMGSGNKEINKNTGAGARERFHNLVIGLSSINDTIMANSSDSIWANNFNINQGTFKQEQQDFTVDSDFTLVGGRYVMLGNNGEIDVAGSVSISSHYIFLKPQARLECAGNLSISGDNIFTSDSGQVRMNGNIDYNTISVSGNGNYFNFLKIEATAAADSMDSVTALTDITADSFNITTGVYSPGGHKTSVTDAVLFVGTNGGLRMNNAADTLDLDEGIILNKGPSHQAITEITNGTILCGGDLHDTTDAGFQPSGGIVIFDGTINSNVYMGDSSYFNNITINKSQNSDSVKLNSNITIKENFIVENGTFYHNNKCVTFNKGGLATVAVIGSPEFYDLIVDGTILDVDSTDITSFISVANLDTCYNWGSIQKIQKKKVSTKSATFNDGFGRDALVFTPTSGSIDTVRIHTRCGSMIPQNAFGSGCAPGITSVSRFTNIVPDNTGTATIRIYYYEGERGSTPADEMPMNRWNTPISHWQLLPEENTTNGVGFGENPHWVEVTNISEFSPFTLGGVGALSVELVYFKALPGPGYITLQWVTASETQNSKWVVYRTEEEEENYTKITELTGQGTIPHETEYRYDDTLVLAQEIYYYKLTSIDEYGDTAWFGPICAIAEFQHLKPGLETNYPNPFIGETSIRYTVPGLISGGNSDKCVNISLKIYDIGGRLIKTILEREEKPGIYTTSWDGTDSNNKSLPGGLYFIRFETGDFVDTRKMVIVR